MSPATIPLSAFCLFELGKLPEGLPVVLAALQKGRARDDHAGADRSARRSRARARGADRCRAAAGAADGQRNARARVDGRLPRGRGAADAPAVDSRVRAAGAQDRRDAADDRLRRREAHRALAPARRQRRHDSGRLGAVRSEARAGGADVRRRRHRFRRGRTTMTRRDAAARRVEEIRRSIQAAGFEPVERDGNFDRRWLMDDRTMIRLGAVSYLNTRPLVHGLDEQPARFSLRSTCRRGARSCCTPTRSISG